ncbi:MAG: NAD(P)H-dependent oxidoreductase subunit E [Peptococcaceae bacterium]|nr:NAD(P)H-dependent oxidoreductase subunit E [Candidatus Syntrophopropionicum ammoniitolerans]
MMCIDSNCGRKEVDTEIDELLTKHKNQPGGVLNFFREYMEVYGKPPSSVLNKAALAFDKEETEIEDLLYSCNILRHTTPGVHRISICMGTTCYLRGAQQVLKTFCGELGVSPGETTADGQFYLEVVRCLGACDFGPSVMVDNEIHPRVSPDKVSSIIKSYS